MKLDAILPDFATAGAIARRAERLSVDGILSSEVAHDPFFPLVAAAAETSTARRGRRRPARPGRW